MKSKLLLITIFLISFSAISQTDFESGFLIQNNGNKVECLIKNEDWIGSPKNFEYKLEENGEVKVGDISNIKEFGAGESFKYIRTTVAVDQSTDVVNNLTDDRNPEMKEEILFLKTLVEGKASLYFSDRQNIKRYFYKLDDGDIEQLIYKRYMVTPSKMGKNERYKQQLALNLTCSSLKKTNFEKLEYKKSYLVKLIKDYNKCQNSQSVQYNKKEKEHWFNLSVRPGVSFSSLQLSNPYGDEDVDFGQNTGLRLGVEMEFLLPFNNDKWAFIIEPTYRTYSAEKEIQYVDFLTIKKFTNIEVTHTSIAFPIGLRHYFFLNDQSKIFINGGIVVDAVLKQEVNSTNENKFDYNKTNESDLEGNAELGFSFGLGYKFQNKFSLEANVSPSRQIFEYNLISSSYTSFSLILGYSLF